MAKDTTRRRGNGRAANATGADHSVMRELNRSLVLDLIKNHTPVSRASIAKATTLAKPTVSAIVDDLINEGLVKEIGVGQTTTGGGRPPILLEFNARSQFIVGVHVGVKRTRIIVADAKGTELEQLEMATPRGRPSEALKKIAASIGKGLAAAGAPRKRLAAVGVCVPGLVDMQSGICLLAPNLGWHDVPVRDLLHAELHVPVYVVNTAQAAVVTETIDGAAQGAKDVVLLYVTTGGGVGSGVLAEGRLVHGSAGLAGEIGHCYIPGGTERCNCGKVGCLETVTDGPAVARAAAAAVRSGRRSTLAVGGRRELTAEEVAAAAADGDRVALDALADAGRTLGLAASWLINVFNPEVLLVGGGMAVAGEALIGPLREVALEHALPQAAQRVDIRSWTMSMHAGVRGAVLVAMQYAETYYRVIFQG